MLQMPHKNRAVPVPSMYDIYGMQGDKHAKAVKDVLIKLGGQDDTINVVYAETEGNQGALDYFGLTEKVLPLVLGCRAPTSHP